MSALELNSFFVERKAEIDEYVSFLGDIEKSAQAGPPRLVGASGAMSASQQKILNSSLYLQLYNLVEATVSRCLDAVTEAAAANGGYQVMQLNRHLRDEWIRTIAGTHVEMTADKRLTHAVAMAEHLLDELPVEKFHIEAGGGGNWDDEAIFKMGKRLGCDLTMSRRVRAAVKRPRRDQLGALKLVKDRRNGLAHGSLSFVDCADGVSVAELRELNQAVSDYLAEVIDCFVTFIDTHIFLRENSRPA